MRLPIRVHSRSFAAARLRRVQAGVTLVELLIVVALVGLLVGITFPSISAGLDSLRLTSAADSLAGFFNAALVRAERRQQPLEVTISKTDRVLSMRSTEPGFLRRLEMPEGVLIRAVLPELPVDAPVRSFLLYPGGTVPRVGVEIENQRGARRLVRLDPITGVPQVERPEAQ